MFSLAAGQAYEGGAWADTTKSQDGHGILLLAGRRACSRSGRSSLLAY